MSPRPCNRCARPQHPGAPCYGYGVRHRPCRTRLPRRDGSRGHVGTSPQTRARDRSAPECGYTDEPYLVSVCLVLESCIPPLTLQARAQAVERALGRERANVRRWGPLQIDIDPIAYEDVALEAPDLTLPHPQLFTRAFVLVPLAEIAPERLIAGRRVRDALAQIDTSGVEKLAERG